MKVHIPPYLLHRDALYDAALRTRDMRALEEMWDLPAREPRPVSAVSPFARRRPA